MNTASSNEKYKFTEKERDKESGLDYFGARYYDSEIGRWLSIDPLADKYPGWSPYAYCLNNPAIYVDPNGDTVVFKDENIRKQHEAFYNQQDKDGNYVNTEYRSQYNTLHKSDIVYNVSDAKLASGKDGNFETDGVNVNIQLDLSQGATIGKTLSHEFVHGIQFENNEIWFTNQNGWGTANNSQEVELKACASQQIKPDWWGTDANNKAEIAQRYKNLSPVSAFIPGTGPKREVIRNDKSFMVVPGAKP